MSALSMASSTIASSPLHIKLSKLDITHSFLTFPPNCLGKPFKLLLKPFKLNARNPCSLSVCSYTQFHRSFAASFDGLETSGDAQLVELVEDGQGGGKEEAEKKLKTGGSREGARLYVGNLPYSMTSSELTEIFKEAGRVSNVEVIYGRVTDRSRGFGFVTMASVEEANEAIRLFNDSQVGGRSLKVNFPEVPWGAEREVMAPKIRSGNKGFVDSPYKIYAGNLDWRLSSVGLREAFAGQRGMLSAIVMYEKKFRKSRGFGFVSFNSAKEADAAIKAMNEVEVKGRPLRLSRAVESSELASSVGA